MSLKKLHLSLLVVSLSGGLIPQAIAAMKRAVELFTTARGGSIHKDAKAQDIRVIERIMRLEMEHLGVGQEAIENLDYYPLKLDFDRIASFGTSVLVATLPPQQVALLTNFHEMLALCFAAVGIPIVGPGSHLNDVFVKQPEPLKCPSEIQQIRDLQRIDKDLNTLVANGPNVGSLACASYYALAGARRVPKFVLCGLCESKSSRKTYREFAPSMKYWNSLMGQIIGLTNTIPAHGHSLIRSIIYSAVTKNLVAQSLADQPIGLDTLLLDEGNGGLGAQTKTSTADLRIVPSSSLYLLESERHRSPLHRDPSLSLDKPSSHSTRVPTGDDTSKSRMHPDLGMLDSSRLGGQNPALGVSIEGSENGSQTMCPSELVPTTEDGHSLFSNEDSLLFSDEDETEEDESGAPEDRTISHRPDKKKDTQGDDDMHMRSYGGPVSSRGNGSKNNTDIMGLSSVRGSALGSARGRTLNEETDNPRKVPDTDADFVYDISRLGMYFFPQVTLLKTSQAGRRTKNAQARRQMRHLRLNPSDYHTAVLEMRRELLPSSAPMEADLYGVHLPFGEDVAISIELLEMSRSDEDGYYRRVGVAPLVKGLGELLEEQCLAYTGSDPSSEDTTAAPSTCSPPTSDAISDPTTKNPTAVECSPTSLSSSLEEGEIRDDLAPHISSVRTSGSQSSSSLISTSPRWSPIPPSATASSPSSAPMGVVIPRLDLGRIAMQYEAVDLPPGTGDTVPSAVASEGPSAVTLAALPRGLKGKRNQDCINDSVVVGAPRGNTCRCASPTLPAEATPPSDVPVDTPTPILHQYWYERNPATTSTSSSLERRQTLRNVVSSTEVRRPQMECLTCGKPLPMRYYRNIKRILHTYWGSNDWSILNESSSEPPLSEQALMVQQLTKQTWGLIVKGTQGWEDEALRYGRMESRAKRITPLNLLVSPLDVIMSSARNYFDNSPELDLPHTM